MTLELARELAKSELIPKDFRSTANAYLLLDASKHLGCSVLELANNSYIKNGKFCYGAAFLIGLANKRLPENISYEVERTKDDVVVTAYTKSSRSSVKLSTAKDQWGTEFYSNEDLAIHCLKLRAGSWLVRSYFPEVTATTTLEEQVDIQSKKIPTTNFVNKFNRRIEK